MASKKVFQLKATIIPQKRLNVLERQEWVVHTCDQITQNGITEYMSKHNEGECCETEIFYDGRRVNVFSVPFCVVLFLKENRHKVPFKFIAYHKKSRSCAWQMWHEGQKTSRETLRFVFRGITAPQDGPSKPTNPNYKKLSMRQI